MSTQNRNSGGGRNQKKSNSGSGGGGGGDSAIQTSTKKTDVSKTEKEKSHPKPTAEQLRIAQITNSNTSEDPQMREKVATLIEMTQRSEEEVCCALYECDNDLERAVVYLLETLPVGAFETSSKKKKNKAASAGQENAGGDGEWTDTNANTDRREKSRNRSSNRGGRGGTDSRGWRGREARENERNLRDTRGGDDRNDNYRRREGGGGGGGGGGRSGGGRGGGYAGRGGRGGGRFGAGGRGTGGRGERSYNSRSGTNEDHQEVELWDNTIAQNAEKQQQQIQDDAWGDWDNEEYVGSLKDSKVFTTSNLPNQTAASVVSGGVGSVSVVSSGTSELSAPPGLEHHLGSSNLVGSATSPQQQGSHLNSLVGNSVGVTGGSPSVGGSTSLNDDSSPVNSAVVQSASVATTPMMQYSAAVASSQLPQSQPLTPQQQQQSSVVPGSNSLAATALSSSAYGSAVDTFSNAATAAANLVQQVQQQQQQQQPQTQIKASATLSAEQSQYFNSLTSQNAAAAAAVQQPLQQQQLASTYAQNAAVQYPTSYANVFGSGAAGTTAATAGLNIAGADQSQLAGGVQQPQVRRARAKLPPPSKIPSTAVEMPGDTLNNIGYLDVQFGGLDFGTEDTFDALPEKFGAAVTIDGQQQQQQQTQSQQQLVQSQQDVANDYQSKSNVQQQQATLSAGLQSAQLSDALSSGYSQRGTAAVQQQQQQQVVSGGSGVGVGVGGGNASVGGASNHSLDLTKSDPYGQTQSATNSAGGYQASAYQTSASVANKTANAYQPSAAGQVYNSSSYANVQSSVANSYQPQSYGSYQQNSMNSYQQQAQQSAVNAQTASNSVTGGAVNVGSSGNAAQNIPVVGGSGGNSSANSNTNTGYLSSGYPTQQSAYQSSQSVYGGTGLSNSTGFAGSTNTSSSQYSNFSTSAKLKDTATASSGSHYESVTSSNVVSSSGGATGNSAVSANSSANQSSSVNSNNSNVNSNSSSAVANNSVSSASNNNVNTNSSSTVSGGGSGAGGSGSSGGGAGGAGSSSSSNPASVVAAAAAAVSSSSSSNKTSASGMVPNIQMVSQYIQTGLPYYQQPVYSYEEIQMMQQRVPHVQGYYDLNYTPTSLGTGRDNLGSVAYSTMTDARFTRTDNNSSPVSNVSSTMSQQAGSGGHMLNVPYYFYSGNVMPGSFQYGTPAIYPQQIPAANTASGGQFPKPSYSTGYGSTSYDTLSQASQDYTKGAYPSSVNQQTKSQNVANPPQTGTTSDITSSMYSKGHVALNKVNSYEKQNFHSGTPPPFNMPNTQTAGGTSAQPYGMYLPMPTAGHHNMIHQPIHQDSNSTGQRQQTSSQSKSAAKQGYSPSYWTGQN
ncbi:protein lingerer isoform X2 [Ceratitis capitata]|uniref:protein lingerer isoform X2 n=1 Tax=Ceratitis capitata TaxID=7213 RepID=UPI0006188C12|nr:protein lingerer isoform X2 [Ceratitis capitata]